MQRCAVFSCLGLGDGLIALVLSNNLQLNGRDVTTFHPSLEGLQKWFPHLPIRRFPSEDELESVLQQFDRFFLIYENSPWMKAILKLCLTKYREKTVVLNPIATSKVDYPYWEEGRFDGNRCFVENLYTFCKNILRFAVTTRSNGIVVPEQVRPRHFIHRVVLHPTSSRVGKNWDLSKFYALARRLQRQGCSPAMILTEEERRNCGVDGMDSPSFATLSDMASYVCESGYMIGNDSGIGHLASCMGLPTLTICRNRQQSKFWRPGWARGEVLTPSGWIPNIKGLRLRDRYWKKWVTVSRVEKKFTQLRSSEALQTSPLTI